MRQKGFTLIELLIVVAIIGIIAAIAIPSLLRARVSANEAATIGDVRTVISAEATYQSANGGYFGAITCLGIPLPCMPAYSGPTFLDANMANTQQTKSGYVRIWTSPAAATVAAALPTVGNNSLSDFQYDATPLTINSTGVRGFQGDGAGRVCFTVDGTAPTQTSSQICNVLN